MSDKSSRVLAALLILLLLTTAVSLTLLQFTPID